jgi:hypothetical protein
MTKKANRKVSPELRAESVQISNPLTLEERRELEKCERTIAKGLKTFFEVGNALIKIRIRKLYRAEFATFEAYCTQRWHMSRFHAYRLIHAAEVVQHLLPIGNIPQHEAQVRPLTHIDRRFVPQVWKTALEIAGQQELTSKHILRAIEQLHGGSQSKSNQPKIEISSSTTTLLLWISQLKKCAIKGDREGALVWIEKIKLLLERVTSVDAAVESEAESHTDLARAP